MQLRISETEVARRPTGKVVGIIKRNWRPFCGMLNASQIKEVTSDGWMVPYHQSAVQIVGCSVPHNIKVTKLSDSSSTLIRKKLSVMFSALRNEEWFLES